MQTTTGPNPFETGALIAGRYEVICPIGRGGMGTVVRVVDHALDNEVIALKILHPHMAKDKTSFARFRNEVLVVRRLAHPNIVRLYDFGDAGGGYYFISMEYVPGHNLNERIYSRELGELSFPEILRILLDVARGIAYAHRKGVVHRDLKPDNILLSNTGEVRITDFGLARTTQVEKGFTETGETVGTPYYMAPEQLRGDKVDGRADIYSLGLMAFELVVGRRPFFDDNYMALANMHFYEPIPVLATRESGLPIWYQEFVQRSAAKRREDRYQTAEEIVALLDEKISSLEGAPSFRRQPAIWSFYGSARARHREVNALKSTSKKVAAALIALILLTATLRASGYSPDFASLIKRAGFLTGISTASTDELTTSIRQANVSAFNSLLPYVRDLNHFDTSGLPPIIVAAKDGPFSFLQTLVEYGASVDQEDRERKTALMHAAKANSVEKVAFLLSQRSNVYTQDSQGRTALMHAADGSNASIVAELIRHGSIVDAADTAGQTALHFASRAGNEAAVEVLLERAAKLELRDSKGFTPLMYSVQGQSPAITRQLLARGANKHEQNDAGKTAVDLATPMQKELLARPFTMGNKDKPIVFRQ